MVWDSEWDCARGENRQKLGKNRCWTEADTVTGLGWGKVGSGRGTGQGKSRARVELGLNRGLAMAETDLGKGIG